MENKKNIFDTLSSEILHNNPYWNYSVDKYIMPNYQPAEYYYVNSRGSVIIIPILNDKFLLTKQYRYLNKKFSIEFPGGGCQAGMSAFENAKIELAQEIGYTSNNIQLLSEFNPCNGMTNELCSVFIARDLIPFQLEADDSEEIEIISFTEEQIKNAILDKTLWDGMTLASWALYKSINKSI